MLDASVKHSVDIYKITQVYCALRLGRYLYMLTSSSSSLINIYCVSYYFYGTHPVVYLFKQNLFYQLVSLHNYFS
jgi:hypothetical protein